MGFFDRLITALTDTHPLHPMVVHFPVGLSGAALLFILLALWKKDEFFERAAFANITLATIGTIFAGFTGMYDNQVNYQGDAPYNGLKVLLTVGLFFATSLTATARWKNADIFETSKFRYVAGYFLSFALAAVLAFLGGVILYGF